MRAEDKFMPKVSIVIPVYNGADYLSEAIDSALAQTYPNVEVVVVNDGSCDNGATEKVALSYGDRIRYFSKQNGGVSSALNYGIKHMTGEYFSWLSHDDKYEPQKVEESVMLLSGVSQREKCVALCGAYYINTKSERIGQAKYAFESGSVYTGPEIVSYILKNGVINGCCMLIPKRAFEECGGFHEGLRYNQDALMWYQIFGAGYEMVTDVSKQYVMYRIHANQTSKTRRDLLLRDSAELTRIISPLFEKLSTKQNNLLYLNAVKQAKSNCLEAARVALDYAKRAGVLTAAMQMKVYGYMLYGAVRQFLRQVYHRLFVGAKKRV